MQYPPYIVGTTIPIISGHWPLLLWQMGVIVQQHCLSLCLCSLCPIFFPHTILQKFQGSPAEPQERTFFRGCIVKETSVAQAVSIHTNSGSKPLLSALFTLATSQGTAWTDCPLWIKEELFPHPE